jgi:hypothetical protein
MISQCRHCQQNYTCACCSKCSHLFLIYSSVSFQAVCRHTPLLSFCLLLNVIINVKGALLKLPFGQK